MILHKSAWMFAAAAALAAGGAQAFAQSGANDVRVGVEAWQAGNFEEAIRRWRPLADRGDADAQYNMAQAYFLGRGVPQNSNLAGQWYERAARQGHVEAQGNLGLILFQNGRRLEAMPWIERAAGRGDPRAQYVLGTALFNGDLVPQDLPRAYAMMSRAAASGLPPAVSQLREMEPHIGAEDRARGIELAAALANAAPTQIASAAPAATGAPPVVTRPARVAPTRIPPSAAADPPPQPHVRPDRAAPRAPRPAPAVAASGRWRVQLGAFGSEANARRAWSAVSARLPGLQPFYVRAGAVTRLQAGPLPSREAASRACAAARQACFPVAP